MIQQRSESTNHPELTTILYHYNDTTKIYRIVVSSEWCALLDLCCIIIVVQDSGQLRVMCTFKIFVVSLMWYELTTILYHINDTTKILKVHITLNWPLSCTTLMIKQRSKSRAPDNFQVQRVITPVDEQKTKRKYEKVISQLYKVYTEQNINKILLINMTQSCQIKHRWNCREPMYRIDRRALALSNALIHVLAHFQRTCSQIYFRFSSILHLLNNTCVKHNFKSVHVSNLFWSREYNSAKEICKYPSFSKVGGNYPLELIFCSVFTLYINWLITFHVFFSFFARRLQQFSQPFW
jgi:hypothetical protein